MEEIDEKNRELEIRAIEDETKYRTQLEEVLDHTNSELAEAHEKEIGKYKKKVDILEQEYENQVHGNDELELQVAKLRSELEEVL